MNKVYKIIWSKAKNCYIVASELAKSHTKAPKSRVVGRTAIIGMLTYIIGCGFAFPLQTEAAYTYSTLFTSGQTAGRHSVSGTASADGFLMITAESADDDVHVKVNGTYVAGEILGQYVIVPISKGASYEIYDSYNESSTFNNTVVRFATGGGGTSYTAGNGITISNDTISAKATNGITVNGNGIGVKAGTGITVDGNGVSITPGSVASGNANAITGGTAYSELRPANGTFVKSNQTTATNLTALDTALADVVDRTHFYGVNSSDSADLNYNGGGAAGLDSIAIGATSRALGKNSIAIGKDSFVKEDNAVSFGHLRNDYIEVDADGYGIPLYDSNYLPRITRIGDGVNPYDAATFGQMSRADGDLSNRIGLVTADGSIIKKSATNNVSKNLIALDGVVGTSVANITIDGNMLNIYKNNNTSISVALPTGGSGSSSSSSSVPSGLADTTTVGSVTAFASNSTPKGYLLCDGRAVSRTTYAALFKKIGTTYGAGDGKTTFNLPNLVNRFVEGSNVSGQYIQAGLPNITGRVGALGEEDTPDWTTGAFYQNWNELVPGDDWGVDYMVYMDASRSSPVYGRSDTVQPESLKMQYYIKIDDDYTGSRYIGVNSTPGGVNEFGDGAKGTDAIAIGKNALASAKNAVAIGTDSVVRNENTVSFGHKHDDVNSSGTQYGANLTRRLINVSEGKSGSDAATVSQTAQVNDGFNSKVNITGLNPIGQHMVQIDVRGEGLVKKDNTGLISGDTIYSEVRQYSDGNYVKKAYTSADNVRALDTQAKINADAIDQERNDRIDAVNAEANARNLADTALSDRIGVQDEDGNYIASSSVNNVSQNIAVLDDQLKVTSDTLTQEIEDRQAAMRTESTNRALADNELSARIGTQSSNGYFIKKSSVNSVADNVAVLDSQLKTVTDGLQEEVENRTTALQTEKEERLAEDTLLSNRIDELAGTAVLYDNSSKAKVTLAGANGTMITNLRAGAVGPNSMDAINGSQLYRTNQLIGTLQQDGRFIQKDANVSDNLQALDDNLASITQNVRVSDESSVKYDDENKDKVTLAGSNGTLIDNLQDGLVEADSKQAITGSQLWNLQNYVNNEISTLQETDRNLDERITRLSGRVDHAVFYDDESHDIATLDGARGTVLKNIRAGEIKEGSMDAVNGGQIFSMKEDMKGLSKDIEQNKNNIRALNTSVIAALDSVTSMGLLVDAMDDIKADASLNNITDSGKGILNSYVTNIVQDYLAGRGLPPVEDTTMNGSNIVPPTAYNTSSTLSVRDEGDGSLSVGHGSNVNGRSSIAMGVGNQVNANNSGIFGDPSVINADASYILGNDDTINTGATGSFIVGNDSVSDAKGGLLFGSNAKATVDAEGGMALGNRAEVSAKGSVALGTNSIADVENTLSIGNHELKRKIVNVANGNISQNSSEAITGAQLFETNEKVQQNTDAIDLHTQQIAQKADVDASNIDASLWGTKLGTGAVASGDTNLVTGGTVYNAIGTAMSNTVASISASVPVKVGENDTILIGNNYGGDTVSVFNKNGEGRVITGVVTNPDDVSSAANVGYVDTVGTNIINGVNGALSSMNSKINKVGANAAALASLNPGSLDGDEKFGVAAAVGNYRDATAGAVGLFYKPQDNVTMNVRGSFGTDENMVGAGVYVALNKGNTPGVSKAQMVKTINAQADQIDKQAKRIHQVEQENANMQHALLQMQARLEALENK